MRGLYHVVIPWSIYSSKVKLNQLETRGFTEQQMKFSSSVICCKHCDELSCCEPRPAATVSYLSMSLIIHHILRALLVRLRRQGYTEDYASSSLLRKRTGAKATAVIWFQSLTPAERHQSLHRVYVNTVLTAVTGEAWLSRRRMFSDPVIINICL